MARSNLLNVPYFIQPTGITCQSTCLKMYASYLEQNVVFESTGGADRDILEIWKDVNQGKERPSQYRNAHVNFKWWLESYFPTLKFFYGDTKDQLIALDRITTFIDQGFPVLVSVSHIKVDGHIILVVGYENYDPIASRFDFSLIVHDPYGAFDPSLRSKLFGKQRFDGGVCLPDGSEGGPGKNVKLPIESVSRQKSGDAMLGTYYTLSATW
jgi:hypothetical protein